MKYVNKQNTKDQVERFGMIVRDDDFYKNAEATLAYELVITANIISPGTINSRYVRPS